MASNPYEDRARAEKVDAIVTVLNALDYGSRIARAFDDHQWRIVAALANVHAPSSVTVDMILTRLTRQEQTAQIHRVAVREARRLLGGDARYLPDVA